ncbi:MAG: hypothetical protein A2270_08015 [Elusimicrobia bacterium RIFOXYA12_FULL_51_18]|nr:MAG: hypothetical protein A2270_08015 [Elusimicrobia bacterium RIFOXYA12_FULL_51_18]OGS30005.1 MAG: hypothetical protein A2218_12680 [Elusimicrobia bacterium RIFOXYA2_FULL_53_38]
MTNNANVIRANAIFARRFSIMVSLYQIDRFMAFLFRRHNLKRDLCPRREAGRKRGRTGRMFPACSLHGRKKTPTTAVLPRKTGTPKKRRQKFYLSYDQRGFMAMAPAEQRSTQAPQPVHFTASTTAMSFMLNAPAGQGSMQAPQDTHFPASTTASGDAFFSQPPFPLPVPGPCPHGPVPSPLGISIPPNYFLKTKPSTTNTIRAVRRSARY